MATISKLVAATALLLLAAWFATGIETDNRVESWIDPSPEAARRYDALRSTFGTDEFLVISVSGDELLSEAALDLQLSCLERLEEIAGVVDIRSPATLYRDLFGAEEPEELREELTSTDFYESLIISPDASTIGYFLTLEQPASSEDRRRLLRDIRAAAADLENAGFELHLGGAALLAAELDRSSTEEALRTLPLAAGAAIVLLLMLLRSLRATLITVLCSTATVVVMLGVMGLLQRPMNMFTAALPAILWVLSLAAILHLLVRYRRELLYHPHHQALSAAVARARKPCVLSSVTTACGFYSLNFAPMTPVREFGTLTGTGILVSLAFTFGIGPSLIEVLRPSPARVEAPIRGISRMSGAAFDRPLTTLLPFAVLALAGVVGLASIRISSNPLRFLPRDSEVLADYGEIAERLGGLSSVEIDISTNDGWLAPEVWARLQSLEATLLAQPEVVKTRSPVGLLKKLNQWDGDLSPEAYRLPADRDTAARLVDEADARVASELTRLVSSDQSRVRLTLFLTDTDSERFAEIADLAESEARQRFGDDVSVTGLVSLLVEAQRDLIRSQLQSLALAGVVIFACLWVGQRSINWALLALSPNIVPVSAVFLAMAVFGLPLDPGTLMVASIALGIAVDDSVHLATSLRRHYGEEPSREGIETSVREVGVALVVTSATAALGFGSLAVARFPPMRTFGLLSAMALVLAFAAGLFVLPALLKLRYHR